MKKNNRVLRIGLLALVLTLVTASLVSGTFAKYVTTVTGTGTVEVAKWDVQLGHNGETGSNTYSKDITFNMFEHYTEGAVSGKQLAPGTSGSFEFTYDTSDTEVAHNVKINLDQTAGQNLDALQYLTFTVSNGTVASFTPDQLVDGVNILDKRVEEGAGTAGNTVTVDWLWPYENKPGESVNDANDTVNGVTPINDAKITVTFTATQLDT